VSAAWIRIVCLALLIGLGLTGVAAAPAQVAQPTITLLAPGNGSLAEGAPSAPGAVTFSWRIDWPKTPTSGTVTVVHRLAADQALTQKVTTTSRSCPAQDVGCWTSVRPSRLYAAGRHYWQVSVTGAATATSPTWMFQSVAARPKPDRVRPRVRAYPGAVTRGRKAIFVARVADDRGEARMQVDFMYRNQLVVRAMTLLKPVRWTVRQRFDSRVRIPRTFAAGMYRLCVTAWDRTGNRAKSCTAYRVR
jgi:hypothetical protein